MAFIDTSFLYALADEGDSNHEDANAVLATLNGGKLTTTAPVLGESWTLMGRRYGHWQASKLISRVRLSDFYEILHVDAETEDRAFDWLLRRNERDYSFVDATSFQVMWDRRIDIALSFDADFDAVGFHTLRA